jgi:RimJ/RimL family protein N-acetyltransferase
MSHRPHPRPEAFEVTLHDARRVRVRPMRRDDREKYLAAVLALSPRSRYLRFAAPLPRVSPRLVEQMMSFDGERHVAYAAFTPDERTMVGACRYIVSGRNPHEAEVALAVADEWQGQGLGRELLGVIVERARHAGLDSLIAMMLSENRACARLAAGVGFAIAGHSGPSTEYEMGLAA